MIIKPERLTAFIRLLLVISLLAAPMSAQKKSAGGEWRYYGGDPGSTKYSPLDQINRENAANLKIAWTWDSPDLPLQKASPALGSFAFEATPLMIGGVLYLSTSLNQVAAV